MKNNSNKRIELHPSNENRGWTDMEMAVCLGWINKEEEA